jgi:hypothetical protein
LEDARFLAAGGDTTADAFFFFLEVISGFDGPELMTFFFFLGVLYDVDDAVLMVESFVIIVDVVDNIVRFVDYCSLLL